MPKEYTCEKCAKKFQQKSGYDAHLKRKKPCMETSALNVIIKQAVNEIVHAHAQPQQQSLFTELVLPEDQITRDAVLQKFFEDIHNLLWNEAGLSPEKALDHLTFLFAYRLIEAQADTLTLPKECRWSYLVNMKDENDLFETVKKGVVEFRKNKKTKSFFKPHEITKADTLYRLIHQINRIPVKALQESDTLGNVFEYMLGRGMSTMSDEGQYFTNRAICRLAFKLAFSVKNTVRRDDGTLCTFADWFCGTGGFPAEYVQGVNKHTVVDWKKENGKVYCLDKNASSVNTTLLNLLIQTGIPFNPEQIRDANSFQDPIILGPHAPFKGAMIDYCFMNPPYGGDKTKGKEYKFAYTKTVTEAGKKVKKYNVNAEIQSIGVEDDDKVSAGVQLGMATLSNDGGVCAIVLPQGFFFGATKKAVELRKKLVEDYKVHYVVDIASGAFLNTGTKTSMMVFQRGVGSTERVKFIGLDEKELVEATLESLRSKNYSLNYKQYLAQEAVEVEGFEMVKLGDLVKFSGGKFTTTFSKENPGQYPFFSGKTHQPDGNCSSFCFDGEEYIVLIKDGGSGIGNYSDSVGMGKSFYVQGKSAGTSHNVALHKKGEKVILKYLHLYLNANRPKIMDLAKYTTGLGVISQGDLADIQIPLPSLERQQQIVEAIDGWTVLAQQEEQSLKTLEKQVMFQVKEMGRGKERVKLGDIMKDVKYPKHPTEYGKDTGKFRFHTGAESTKLYTDTPDIDSLVIIVNRTNGSGKCHIFIDSKCSVATQTITFATKNDMTTVFLYYYFKNDISILEAGYQGACHKNLTTQYISNLEIPLPPLAEQQTLQSDFDEIRHKHAKIAAYKAKAQEAIQRLIPGAA